MLKDIYFEVSGMVSPSTIIPITELRAKYSKTQHIQIQRIQIQDPQDRRYQAKMKRQASTDLMNNNKLCKEEIPPKTWIEKVELIEPEECTLSVVENFLPMCEELKILGFILIEKIEVASFGLTLDDFVDRLDTLLCCVSEIEEKVRKQVRSVGIVELARKLKKVNFSNDFRIQEPMRACLKFLYQKGFGVEKVLAIFRRLQELRDKGCKDVCRKRNGCMPAKKYVELGAPLLANRKPSIVELYDLIEELRKYSSVSARGERSNELGEVANKLESWLDYHPMILRYMDPWFVIAEPVDLQIPDSIAVTLNTIPTIVSFDIPNDIGNRHFSSLYSCETQHDAWGIATALRTAHSDGHGRGGTGTAVRIGIIRSSTGAFFTL